MLPQLINMLEVPLTLFCLFVAPVWLVMHYKAKNKPNPEASEADKRKIEELLAMSEKMESRIETLESILDKQDPNWRHEV